jgi:hypothetical protein
MSSKSYRSASWSHPRAEVRASHIQGTGMYAKEPISEGEVVAICGGMVMTTAQFQEYTATVTSYSAIQIGEDAHLVELPPTQGASQTDAGGMNHCCDSNVWMRDEVTLLARRDIDVGEELTIDYALLSELPTDVLGEPCRCGSPVCRRRITGNDWQRREVQERYQGHFSPFLNERIRHFSRLP